MGCGNSNLLQDEEIADKYNLSHDLYKRNLHHANILVEDQPEIANKIENSCSSIPKLKLLFEEFKSSYISKGISEDELTQAVYTIAAFHYLKSQEKIDFDIKNFVYNELLCLKTYEDHEISLFKNMVYSTLSLPDRSDITVYEGNQYPVEYCRYIFDNLKYNKVFYKEIIFLKLYSEDLQNSQKMIDLGEIIRHNKSINTIILFLEPIIGYDHRKYKEMKYYCNCSNLSYIFDALLDNYKIKNLVIVSHQKLNMKLTEEATKKFFEIFNSSCDIESLVLINFDLKEKAYKKFSKLFAENKLKLFVLQPTYPSDRLLANITKSILMSKTLEIAILLLSTKCSNYAMQKAHRCLNKSTSLKRFFFEDNYYFLKHSSKKKKSKDGMDIVRENSEF